MSATFPMTARQTHLFTPIFRDYDKDLPVVQIIPSTWKFVKKIICILKIKSPNI